MKFKPMSRKQESAADKRRRWLGHDLQRECERRCFYLAFESRGKLQDWQIELLRGMTSYNEHGRVRIEARIAAQ